MKLKTTKELMDEINDRPAMWLAWAVIWRMWAVAFAIGIIIEFIDVL